MKIKKKKTNAQEKKITELEINPVRDYLKENPTKKLSIRYLKNHLGVPMKKSKIYYYCTNSNHIKFVSPHEVGSYKQKLNVFQYKA